MTKLQEITQLYKHSVTEIADSHAEWMNFLECAANNYKYNFPNQVLIFTQKPTATACAEISLWNERFSRWVNRGAKGIALLDNSGNRARLRYVFDVSDTNSRRGAEVKLWSFEEKDTAELTDALSNAFGSIGTGNSFTETIIQTARTITEDNLVDYRIQLTETVDGSYFQGLAPEDLDRILTEAVSGSVAYMMLSRCGLNAREYYDFEVFRPVLFFNTPEALSVLGNAGSDIAEMGLREIESTVRHIQIKERNLNRTFVKPAISGYDEAAKTNESTERSNDNDTDTVHEGGRLSDSESDITAAGGISAADEVWDVAQDLFAEPPERDLHNPVHEQRTEPAPVRNTDTGGRNDGEPYKADGSAAGRDREAQGGESDALGSADEQYTELGGGNGADTADLPLSADFPTVEEQQQNIEESEAAAVSDFSISQEDIDAVLTRGSGVSQGKMRIFEQYQRKETAAENIKMLRDEYGIGGAYPAVTGRKLDEGHDGKGIKISRGSIVKPDAFVLLSWSSVEKRIGELIVCDRYLSEKEKEQYPVYLREKTDREARWKISEEFRSLVNDYNDYWTQIGETDKCLNQYYLSGCCQAFGVGDKKMYDRVAEGDYIIPMMREALTGIISENTHHRERAETLYEQLNSELAMQLEPTYDEMNPPPEPEKEYRFSLGDTVYLGIGKYEIVFYDETTVRLFDEAFPLFSKEMPRAEFDTKLRENPLNDKYLFVTEEEPMQSSPWDEYRLIKNRNPDAVVLYQVDDFFEVLGEDAEKVADMLNITLTYRSVSDSEKLPMCGIPVYRLSTYTEMLTDRGFDVVIAEQNVSMHRVERLVSQHRDAPVQSYPIGRIDFLGDDGQIEDNIEYLDEAEFIRDIAEEYGYGTQLPVKVYRDRDGNTIPTDFTEQYISPPLDYEIIDSPYPEKTTAEITDDAVEIDVESEQTVETNIGNVPIEDYREIIAIQNGYDSYEDMYNQGVRLGNRMDKEPEPEFPQWEQKPKKRTQSFDLHPEIPQSKRQNFRIADDELGIGTPGERYANNTAAIRLLKALESENRFATPAEQETLSKYVGWGGLSDCFREDNSHYGELKNLLSEDEYASARESTLTAFYTPPVVIRAMYQAFTNMGFRAGNVLEPSCGVGNFLGMLPDSMADCKLYGVELDSVSGRIAQQLYQKSSIAVQGFEKTDLPDSFFDAAIGNVPFGQFKVPDKRYDKNNFLIHDYFFARTLDNVRPGGVIAFITSKGTLDKENPSVRKYIAQHADLLGAIRLPNNTFKGAAGTEVTSDIIFLQKRDKLIDIEPDWVHLGKDTNGITINQYFVDNPDMIMGEMQMISGQFGKESACLPYDGQDLSTMLNDAVQNIHAEITEYELDELEDEAEDFSIPADPSVRNYSYALADGKLYFRENSRMNPIDVSITAENRIKGMIAIRDCVRTLIEYQTEDYPETEIKAEQEKLNTLYDDFTKKYGIINSRANSTVFGSDSSYFLLTSLEIIDDEGNFLRKADMFSKRTIKKRTVVTSVDTASEALSVSLSEKAAVDMPFMEQLTGKTEQEICADLTGVIFLNPLHISEEDGRPKYLTADEYLAGNVREKLAVARRSAELYPQDYTANVQALEAVQPVDLTASEISVRLGATWIPTDIIQDFMFELFSTPRYCQWNIKVHYSDYTGEWNVEGKSYDRGNVKAANTYGTDRINGYKIIEETLNLRDVRIIDYFEDSEGRKQAVLNREETAIAQGKQELIKSAFQDWIWQDPERRQILCKLYNEKFNSNRAREYDGSFLNFVGMNPEITLRTHQINAVARGLLGGNELLAHVVGAGKTFTMVAIAQEAKRLGLCQKSLFVVPNHLTEQWASEYLQLYPAANILVATKKDFETKNRKRFCGRIATGDYDAVIIGHSQFEKIPMSIERQRYILEQQLQEILDGIADMKRNRGDNFSIKQLERTKKTIRQKIEKLNDQSRKDDLITFEELGIDRLFVDEAHYYKNLAAFTKMRNVGGISQTEAMKSSDLYMKCRYLDELTGGRGIVFATGTPVSNSMVELYTMQKYLQYNTLKKNDLLHFDSWASTFGETVTAIELAPEGTGYRAKTRFARFYNLPELIMMFREVADIQTADMLNLPVPQANYHNIALKPSEQQREMVEALSKRAEKVRNKMVNSSVDNMLLITNDGRKLALDQRLMNELLPDSETGKTAACAADIYAIWERTSEQRSTQMVFCDLSTPHGDESFNIYDDLRNKLIGKGIPAEEISFIHDAKTEVQKKELFGKVRAGQIRILIGSTQKMGAGTNVQKKLVALYHIDCPWRPSDLQQREGRIIRQGNENPEVEIYSYVTEATFDAYLYQMVETKQKFIGQIMTSKSPVRSAEDIDETALSYAEIKALASGNPYIKEKMDLDIDVARLKLLKANHLSQRYSLEDQIIRDFPQRIAATEQRIDALKIEISFLAESTHPNADGFCAMEIRGVVYTDKKEAGTALLAACKAMTSPDAVQLGQYRGFMMELSFDSTTREFKVNLKHLIRHTVSLGSDIFGNIQRLDNALAALPDQLTACISQLENTKVQLENAKAEVARPFPKEEELTAKNARLAELNALLDMNHADNEIVDGEPAENDVPETRVKNEAR